MIKYLIYCIFFASFSINSEAQNLQWALDYQDTGVRWGETIGVDSNSNVIIAFPFGGSNDADPSSNQNIHVSNGVGDTCIAKYSSDGQYLWSISFGGISQDIPHKLIIDNDDNIILIGNFNGNVDFDPSSNVSNINSLGDSIYIVKYDTNGNFIWARSFGNATTYAFSIDFDNQNNLYLVGSFEPGISNIACDFDVTSNTNLVYSLGNKDSYIMKISPEGYNVWLQIIGTNNIEFFQNIKVNKNENAFCIIGGVNGTVDLDTGANEFLITPINGGNLVIAKYDLNANFIWAKSFENVNSNSSLNGNILNFDSNNNIFFSGYFYNSVDFDPDTGQAIFTSTPISTVTYEDSFICKLDNNGNYIGTKTFSSIYQDKVIDFDIDSENNLYLVGNFKGTINFDLNNSNYSLTSLGEYDSYFIKLDNNLNFSWAHKIGNNQNDDRIKDIIIDNSNNIIISGDYKFTIDVDLSNNSYTITSNNSSYDAYIIKYNNLDLLSLDSFFENNITIYPNPCHDYLLFSTEKNIDEIVIYNSLGKKCLYLESPLNNDLINISNLENGLYYLFVTSENKIYKEKIIKK